MSPRLNAQRSMTPVPKGTRSAPTHSRFEGHAGLGSSVYGATWEQGQRGSGAVGGGAPTRPKEGQLPNRARTPPAPGMVGQSPRPIISPRYHCQGLEPSAVKRTPPLDSLPTQGLRHL